MIQQFHFWVYTKTIESGDLTFIAALLTIARRWKQPKCQQWMNNQNMIHMSNRILSRL